MAHAGKSEEPRQGGGSTLREKEEGSNTISANSYNKKVRVCICCGSDPNTVDGLKQCIKTNMSREVESVFFKQLPYNIQDMLTIDLSDIDVLLLCHSINNRRFSITDVTDALYDEFLREAKTYLGKSKVGVIAYDFRSEDLEGDKLEDRMEAFRRNQSSTFKFTSLALIGGQLSTSSVELTPNQLEEMREFFRKASDPPAMETLEVFLHRILASLCCFTP